MDMATNFKIMDIQFSLTRIENSLGRIETLLFIFLVYYIVNKIIGFAKMMTTPTKGT